MFNYPFCNMIFSEIQSIYIYVSQCKISVCPSLVLIACPTELGYKALHFEQDFMVSPLPFGIPDEFASPRWIKLYMLSSLTFFLLIRVWPITLHFLKLVLSWLGVIWNLNLLITSRLCFLAFKQLLFACTELIIVAQEWFRYDAKFWSICILY